MERRDAYAPLQLENLNFITITLKHGKLNVHASITAQPKDGGWVPPLSVGTDELVDPQDPAMSVVKMAFELIAKREDLTLKF